MTTLKDFEAYLRVRDYMVGNDHTFEDILKDFDNRIITITTSCDGVRKKIYSLASVANYMGVSSATVKYAYSKRRDMIRKKKGSTKVFHVEWEKNSLFSDSISYQLPLLIQNLHDLYERIYVEQCYISILV